MPKLDTSKFEQSVFINCPFDSDYDSLLRPLLFTILYFGFTPRISSERSDSAEQRIDKICEFIKSSRYSIHDLSRLRAKEEGELARHNMPFELGIDFGLRKFAKANGLFRTKRFLVMEKDRYEYSKALSDLGGVDIKNHQDDPEEVVRAVRNWFYETVGVRPLAPATKIHSAFVDFMADLDSNRKIEGFEGKDIYNMPTSEFMDYIRAWLVVKAAKNAARGVSKGLSPRNRAPSNFA